MTEKTGTRRENLAANLVAAALARIERDGVAALRARDLAADAGCAVGGIYTVFADMNAVILQANAVTFRELGQFVTDAVAARGDVAPADKLIAMGHAYLAFAQAHPRRWSALFDVNLPQDAEIPDWYRAEVALLFEIIADPLRALRTDLDDAGVRLFTRTLFSAIHGIVLLGVAGRMSGVPAPQLRDAIEMLLRSALRPDATSV